MATDSARARHSRSARCTAMPARAVQISELLYDAIGTDNGTVFIELYGAPGTSLDGWHVEGVNGADGAVGPIVTLSGQIGSDGFFVLADSDAGATQVANADLLANFDFQNGPDSVVLRDALGNVLDALGYGVFGATDIFAGEGQRGAGRRRGSEPRALVRQPRHATTTLADFALLDVPTPGTGPIAVPEAGRGGAARAVRVRALRRAPAHSHPLGGQVGPPPPGVVRSSSDSGPPLFGSAPRDGRYVARPSCVSHNRPRRGDTGDGRRLQHEHPLPGADLPRPDRGRRKGQPEHHHVAVPRRSDSLLEEDELRRSGRRRGSRVDRASAHGSAAQRDGAGAQVRQGRRQARAGLGGRADQSGRARFRAARSSARTCSRAARSTK